MIFSGIHHVAIICSDYQKAKRFYTELLGFSIIQETYRSERKSYKLDLLVPGCEHSQIELFSFPDSPARLSLPEACGLRHVAFKVISINKALEHLEKNVIEYEPVRVDEITGKRFTFFKDPDNLPLEIYEI